MKKIFSFFIIVMCSPYLFAAEVQKNTDANKKNGYDDVKKISGISIVGNDEAPKSLFIVPWKSSEIGFESELTAQSLLDGSLRPLDKEVFGRELDYFDIRSGKDDH